MVAARKEKQTQDKSCGYHKRTNAGFEPHDY